MKTSRFFIIAAIAAMATVYTTNISAADVVAETSAKTENVAAKSTTYYYVDKSTSDRVEAESSDRYTQTFYSGESVVICVKGDGDTDLDLYIYDSNGNLVTSDTDSGDFCLCAFTPRRTQRYTIKIKNWGRVYNRYQLSMVQ